MGVIADYSEARRIQAVQSIKVAYAAGLRDLDYDARMVFAVGTLVADEQGVFSDEDLMAAVKDPSIVQAARELMRLAVAP